MRLTLENGFNEDQFRWSFIFGGGGMGGSAAEAEANAGGSQNFSSGGPSDTNDNGGDNYADFFDNEGQLVDVSYDVDDGMYSGGGGDDLATTAQPDTGFRFFEPPTTAYTPPAPQSPISSYFEPRTFTAPELASRAGVMSPYRPDAVTFASGQPTMTFDAFATPSPTVFNMGRTQQQMDDRNFLERIGEAVGDRLGLTYQNQRANIYDPTFDRFTTEGMVKTSDNPFTDLIANALAAPFGSTVDTATYVPMTGGDEYLYQSAGGLLGMLQDPTLRLKSEVEAETRAQQAAMSGDGDGGGDQPLIIPEEVAEVDERGEPTAFPSFSPRTYEYQPFTSKFYTIPSRFTQPTSLLG